MGLLPLPVGFFCLLTILFCVHPVAGFGAGDIASTSKIEGQNWRHGDIENTLLTIMMARATGGDKFGKLDVKRVHPWSYFLRTMLRQLTLVGLFWQLAS